MRSLLLRSVLAFGLLFSAPVALAGDGFAELAEELQLTPAQRTQITELLYQSRSARIEIKARADKAKLELKHAITADVVDEKVVQKALDAFNAAQADLARNRVNQILAIRKQLNPDQWTKLKEEWGELKEDRLDRLRDRLGRGEDEDE